MAVDIDSPTPSLVSAINLFSLRLVYTDRQINGAAKLEGLVDSTTIERSFVEYRLKSSIPPKNPLTLTIFNGEPFEILCIDEVPNRFSK